MSVLVVIPNVLSGVRLGLAAWFPFAPIGWRLAIILAAVLSDFTDGYIARRYRATSWVGGLLDSIADKLFALSVLVTLSLDGTLSLWQLPLLLLRDLTVAAIALYAGAARRWDAFRHMPARLPGKLTTGCIFAYFIVLVWTPRPTTLAWTAFALAVTMSVLAAADYLRLFRSVQRNPDLLASRAAGSAST